MGTGYRYECENCGESSNVLLGMGYSFPDVCERVMDGIAAGEFGPELQQAQAKSSMSGVCAEARLYECKSCGHWEVIPDATLYEPRDDQLEDILVSVRGGGQKALATRRIPFLIRDDLKLCRVLAEFHPTCSCGGEMRRVRRLRGHKLACPTCGHKNTLSADKIIMWD